tara:strand:+ start:4974 stop:5177 length:204 start_codon:yes stop_codon:yes gene_type:complete
MQIGKKIGLDPQYWGSKSEAEFLETFKNGASINVLKKAYASLPKPKKVEKTKKEKDAGRLSDSGKDK